MDSVVFLAVMAACAALLIRGLFLLAFRRGRRWRGAALVIAAPVALFAYASFDMHRTAVSEGWASFAEKAAAQRAGISDPEAWRAEQEAARAAAAKAEAEAEQARQAAIAAEAAAEAAEEAAFREQGFHCLSAWDGSNADLVRQVTAQLRDPDSFEHIETRIAKVVDGKHATFMQYRARNGFGGFNVAAAIASVDTETCMATVVAFE